MDPLTQALLSRWEWRPEVLVVLVPLGVLYIRGWCLLRRQSTKGKLATWLRLIAYLSGLFVMALSLISPIDRLGGQLFFMHMIQHLLIIMIAAPLIWLGGPFPFMLWSLPVQPRRRIAKLFTRTSSFRRALAAATRPGIAWLTFITVYLGWHDAHLYNLALRFAWVHDLEHITFFLAAMLYWWHVIGGAPHIHGRFPGWARMAYLVATIPPNMAIGVAIAFSTEVIYTYYNSVPPIWGLTVLQDQMLGGAIMWIPGSMMFIVATLIILATMFRDKNIDSPMERPGWDSEDAMIAPGLEHRLVQNKWKKLASNRVKVVDVP